MADAGRSEGAPAPGAGPGGPAAGGPAPGGPDGPNGGGANLDRGGQLSERLLAWVGRTIRGFGQWTVRFSRECVRAWKYLDGDQRVAAIGCGLLIVSTFGNFSFVEAAVVLTAIAILILLKKRGDGRQFHLPFGDGLIIMAGGAWSALLIVVRLFDRPLGQNLLALVCAAIIVIAGLRIRVRRPIDDLPQERAAQEAAGGRRRRPGVAIDLAQPGEAATSATQALPRDQEATQALPRDTPAATEQPSGVRRRRSRTQTVPDGQLPLEATPQPAAPTERPAAPTERPAAQAPPPQAQPPAAEPTPRPPQAPPPTAPPARDETAVRPQPRTPAARRAAQRPGPLDMPPPQAPQSAPPAQQPDPDFDVPAPPPAPPRAQPAPPPPPPPEPEEPSPFRARRAAPEPPAGEDDPTGRLPGGRRPPREG